MDTWRRSALLYRVFSGHYILAVEPETCVSQRAFLRVRVVLWHRGFSGDEFDRGAALGAVQEQHVQTWGVIQGLLVHMFLIGLPIAYSARKFSK
jgi:hypothetical protein